MKNIIEGLFKLKLLSNGIYQGSSIGSFNLKQLFGGTIVGQGISLGYELVPKNFFLNNIHLSYFKKGVPNTPINYKIEELVETKVFRRIFLSVQQNYVNISRISMSFKIPEESKNFNYIPPFNSLSQVHQSLTSDEILENPKKVSPILVANAKSFQNWLKDFPFLIKPVDPKTFKDDGTPVMSYWFQLKSDIDLPNESVSLNHMLLAFLSDYGIIYPIIFKNPMVKYNFASSLDYNIWYHANQFDIKQNFLIENRCLYSNAALTLNIGTIWSENHQLIATITQQGLLRESSSDTSQPQFAH